MARWMLSFETRVVTTNRMMRMHRMEMHRTTDAYRELSGWLARQAKIPPCDCIEVETFPYYRGGVLADVGAEFLMVKAAIDGLKDAGVIVDDSPRHVARLTMNAPRIGERDRLVLEIKALAAPEAVEVPEARARQLPRARHSARVTRARPAS